MADYQEAQRAEKTKQKEPLGVSKTQKKPSEQKAVVCPNCSASVPDGALFCGECGFDLSQPLFCPNCGAKTNPGADICPVCKTWLLEGKCKFCYAELSAEAAFCPDCGNPKNGIVCQTCGTLSIFDFCSGCGTPLSEGARAALEQSKNTPEAKAVVDAIQKSATIESELAELENIINNAPEPETAPPVRKVFFTEQKMAAIMKTDQNREAAAQRRVETEKKQQENEQLAKIKEATARKAELERQKAVAIEELSAAARKFASKTFLSHQEARRWHSAHHHPNAVGWLCNFTNTVHLYPAGANDCDQPGLGGCDYFGDTISVNISGPA
jgi:hypothetical protein